MLAIHDHIFIRSISIDREQWHLRAVRVNVIYRRRILGGDDGWIYELKQLYRVRHPRYANHCVPLPRFIICVRSTRHRKSYSKEKRAYNHFGFGIRCATPKL